MTYNVFGATLNLALSIYLGKQIYLWSISEVSSNVNSAWDVAEYCIKCTVLQPVPGNAEQGEKKERIICSAFYWMIVTDLVAVFARLVAVCYFFGDVAVCGGGSMKLLK